MPDGERSRGDTAHPITFVPTPAQWRYLREFLAHDGPNNLKAIAARANVNWRTVYDWREDERFNHWFRDECARHFLHTLPLLRRVTEKFALAGSPEHIKLMMQWAGITGAGSNDQHRPATMGVFINVPRPPQLEETEAPRLDAEHVRIIEQAEDGSVAAALVTPREDRE